MEKRSFSTDELQRDNATKLSIQYIKHTDNLSVWLVWSYISNKSPFQKEL